MCTKRYGSEGKHGGDLIHRYSNKSRIRLKGKVYPCKVIILARDHKDGVTQWTILVVCRGRYVG